MGSAAGVGWHASQAQKQHPLRHHHRELPQAAQQAPGAGTAPSVCHWIDGRRSSLARAGAYEAETTWGTQTASTTPSSPRAKVIIRRPVFGSRLIESVTPRAARGPTASRIWMASNAGLDGRICKGRSAARSEAVPSHRGAARMAIAATRAGDAGSNVGDLRIPTTRTYRGRYRGNVGDRRRPVEWEGLAVCRQCRSTRASE